MLVNYYYYYFCCIALQKDYINNNKEKVLACTGVQRMFRII